jgi:hypothetical protein
MLEVVLLLPNTDRLQQVKNYVRGVTWQFENAKAIYRFHRLSVFDRSRRQQP